VKKAGLPHGPFKTLRKSTGTAVEVLKPGTGQFLLGDTRKEFERHYQDAMQVEVPQPPELG
jgi:hypothetical protein